MPKQPCLVCGRYSDLFETDKALTDHMTQIHPNDPRTLDRVKHQHVASYGSPDVGKTKPPQSA